MEFEVIKRDHVKRNILIGIVAVVIISTIILNFTRAKYRSVATTPLIHSVINYSLADLNIVAITVEGKQVDTIPEGNYELTSESYCEINGVRDDSVELSYDSGTQTLNVVPYTTKGTKCYLYFDEEKILAVDTILAGKDIQTRNDFSTPVTNTTAGVIYQTTDWKGTSYYFAGNPTDNWVYFGGFYWRIVRVNGDGSVRLIYNGTGTTTTGTETLADISEGFNSISDRSEYVGLKYTIGEQHGQNTTNLMMNILQLWYVNSGLSSSQYSQNIDTNVGFCSDRNMASGYSWSSQPTNIIDYAARERLETNKSPSLACNSNDIIKEPVGLITADEVAYAGGIYGTNNTSYYLYNNQNYWTMSPYYFFGSRGLSTAGVFYINLNGTLYPSRVDVPSGVRPVINLSSDVQLTGSGTSTDPYTL